MDINEVKKLIAEVRAQFPAKSSPCVAAGDRSTGDIVAAMIQADAAIRVADRVAEVSEKALRLAQEGN